MHMQNAQKVHISIFDVSPYLGCLHVCNPGRVMAPCEHGYVDALDDRHRDLLDGLLRPVPDAEGHPDVVAVVVQLLVEARFELELPGGEHEVLPDHGARLPAASGGGKLDLPEDGKGCE